MAYLPDLSYGPDTRIVLVGTTICPSDMEALPPVPHAKNNIDYLSRLFTDPDICGLEEDCIRRVLDRENANEITEEIAQAAQEATDTLLVYYVGHGLYGDAVIPLYLCAQRTTEQRKVFNGVSVELVKKAIRSSPARKRILILDCCYSGKALDGGMAAINAEAAVQPAIDIEGTYGIAAVPAHAKALAPPNEKFTRFTGALIDVLEHGLPTDNRVLNLEDVFAEVERKIVRKGDAAPPKQINWAEGQKFRVALNRSLHRRELNRLYEAVEGLRETVTVTGARLQALEAERELSTRLAEEAVQGLRETVTVTGARLQALEARQISSFEELSTRLAKSSAWMLATGLIAAGLAAVAVCVAAYLAATSKTSDYPARAIGPLQAAEIEAIQKALAANPAKPSDPFQECQYCPSMRAIPAGKFLLGSNLAYDERGPNGEPLAVTIPRPFAIGRYEVTLDEFRAFVRATGHPVNVDCNVYDGLEAWNNTKDTALHHSFEQKGDKPVEQRADEPVVCVSWNDANAYIRWLNKEVRGTGQGGNPYRLPSEAEWEYAARGGPGAVEGGRLKHWWGEADSHFFANYGSETSGPLKEGWDTWDFTAPVSTFPPNPFGLAHMLGNVSEWVADCRIRLGHQDNPADGSPRDAKDCKNRIVRGGSWRDASGKLASSYRTDEPADSRTDYIGFRVARDF